MVGLKVVCLGLDLGWCFAFGWLAILCGSGGND
jgi:hypothetical protein